MHRFFLPPAESDADASRLSRREAHHALNVLRLRPGERVVVLNGSGDEYLCEVTEVSRQEVLLRRIQKHRQRLLPGAITLIQAVPKGKAMDLIVQKATELGLRRLVPILSERSVTRLEDEAGPAKQARWRATAIEAIKQCGSAWLPEILDPMTPAAFLAKGMNAELALVASLQPGAQHPRRHFEAFRADHGRLPQTVAIWVGPEGDFTPAEMNLIQGAGALPITLGPTVLRSETAALYCLAVAAYELQAGETK
jgi:16S rRNA (uracil1498-N3)-methyltransferase